MQVKAEGAVQGYVERRSRGGGGLPIGGLLCEGPRSGGASIGDSGRSDALIDVCKQAEGKQAKCVDRSAEVRTDGRRLLRFVRIGSLEITAEGGRPVDLTIILVAVLLLAFLAGPWSRTDVKVMSLMTYLGLSGPFVSLVRGAG